MPQDYETLAPPLDVEVADILDAMRQEGGYLDVAPSDVQALYRLAYAHAAARLLRDAPVREIMTPRVVAATPDQTALEAARIMADAGVSGLPVVSGETVVGVLSIKDLLRLMDLPDKAHPATLVALLLHPATCAAPAVPRAGETAIAEIMTAPAVTIGPDTPRSEATALMIARGINRLPVVDGRRLCGIVSRGDVVRSCRGAPGGNGI
ncbi:MAG: CBS domain-containing protein [Solidesulfovibrio sp.]